MAKHRIVLGIITTGAEKSGSMIITPLQSIEIHVVPTGVRGTWVVSSGVEEEQ